MTGTSPPSCLLLDNQQYMSMKVVRAWYIRLNGLNVPYAPQPRFIAPMFLGVIVLLVYLRFGR